jgi:ComF family protein
MVTQTLKQLGGAALDLLYPPRCALCNKHGSFLCEPCRDTLPRAEGVRCDACWLPLRGSHCAACAEHPLALKALRSVFHYEGGARTLVQDFKFRGHTSLDKPLAAELARTLDDHGLETDLIVPVPLTTSRRRGRGYNQAALLARELSRLGGVPWADALRRTRSAPPQAQSAGADERRRNVIGAFAVAAPQQVTGRHVLLIDDVATTGATLNACAIELLQAGAAAVIGLTLARED